MSFDSPIMRYTSSSLSPFVHACLECAWFNQIRAGKLKQKVTRLGTHETEPSVRSTFLPVPFDLHSNKTAAFSIYYYCPNSLFSSSLSLFHYSYRYTWPLPLLFFTPWKAKRQHEYHHPNTRWHIPILHWSSALDRDHIFVDAEHDIFLPLQMSRSVWIIGSVCTHRSGSQHLTSSRGSTSIDTMDSCSIVQVPDDYNGWCSIQDHRWSRASECTAGDIHWKPSNGIGCVDVGRGVPQVLQCYGQEAITVYTIPRLVHGHVCHGVCWSGESKECCRGNGRCCERG